MSASPKKKMKYSQNKAKFYAKSSNSHQQQYLAPGMHGFLATCNFREKDCVREAYNVLRFVADELYGPEFKPETEVEAGKNDTNDINDAKDDIADQLQKEVNAAKTDKKAAKRSRAFTRFQRVETGANNCIFIRTTLDDPVKLASTIVEEIKSSGLQKTRFLLRLIPIESVCRIDELDSSAGKLFDKHFLKEASTFSIVFNRRCNNDVKRDKIIAQLADLVSTKNIANKVDLKNPEKTVVVEIVKGLCLLSVIPGYIQRKKFNLVEIAHGEKEEGAQKMPVEKPEDDVPLETSTKSKPDVEEKGENDEKT